MFNVQFISDRGPSEEIAAITLRMQNRALCALEQGNKITIVYTFTDRVPTWTNSTIANALINDALKSKMRIFKSVFEIVDGNLKYVGHYDQSYSGNSQKKSSQFICGIGQF